MIKQIQIVRFSGYRLFIKTTKTVFFAGLSIFLLGSCSSKDNIEHSQSHPEPLLTSGKYCTSAFISNPHFMELSPNGKYLVVLEDSISDDYQHHFQSFRTFLLNGKGGFISNNIQFTAIVNYQTAAYSWTDKNEIFFAQKNNARLDDYHIYNFETETFKPAEREELYLKMRRLEGRTSPTVMDHYAVQDQILFSGWRPNIYGENTLRIYKKKKTNTLTLQISAHQTPPPFNGFVSDANGLPVKNPTPQKTLDGIDIYEYKPQDEVVIYSPDYYRTAFSRKIQPRFDNKSVSHFYFTSNKNRNQTVLYRYDDKKGTGEISEIYAPNGTLSHISFNRNYKQPYWIYSENNLQKYHFFNPQAKALFSQIGANSTHNSEIVSMDNLNRKAIVKHSAPSGKMDFLLIDSKKKTKTVILSCDKIL